MFKCEDLLRKNSIDSYYEFLFTMALAAECGRRGSSLDMSTIRLLDKGMLSKDDLEYMYYLRAIGSIYDGSNHSHDGICDIGSMKYYFNVNAISDMYDKLFKNDEVNNCYYWDTDYAYEMYNEKYSIDILNRRKIGNTILHLMAHMLICFILGEREEKVVNFYFKTCEVSTIYMYIDLFACCRTIDTLKNTASIVFDSNYSDKLGDIDFNIHYGMAMHARRLKKWSCKEKFDIFKNYGFKKGSMAILYEREKVSQSNPIGTITRSSVIRIDDFTDVVDDKDRNMASAGWKVTQFSVNKTIEEREDDYFGIDDEYRYAFSDLLKPSLNSISSFLPFDNVGIGTYFFDEEYLILPIEREEKVTKKVSVNGELVTLELDDVEAIYWILKEYGIKFNDELYRDFYNNGELMLWDTVDGTPVHRGREVYVENNYVD